MKRRLTLITVMLVTLLALTSCEGLFGKDDGPEIDNGTFEQMVIDTVSVDISAVRTEVFNLIGRMGTVDSSEPAKSREIVFGNTSRPITATARAELESYVAKQKDLDLGYIIYFDGKSVAIYWQDSRLADLAVSDFYNDCILEDRLELKEGTIVCKAFNARALDQDVYWLAIEQTAPADLYQALRRLNTFFDGAKVCEWMANLWDDDVGGFYYAASSRDNEPFRPDLESTNQITSWLMTNGAMDDVNKSFPNEMKMKIVDFVKAMQSEKDGYFYHPQWPQGKENLNNDRYGRDLSWGVALINRFTVDRDGDGVEEKQYPNYCTTSGAKCKEHAKNGGSCSTVNATSSSTGLGIVASNASTAVTIGIQSSVSSAVSKIPTSDVKATVSSTPNYSSSAAFTAWLEEYCATIKTDSGRAHNINALQDEIIAKGFCDELLDFLDKNQAEVYEEQLRNGETPTGLWQYDTNYRFVWGILKYMPFYNNGKYGRAIAHPVEIVASCMEVILMPRDQMSYAMNDLMNQFSSITQIISNVNNKHNDGKGDPDLVREIREMLLSRGADLVNNAMHKLEIFKLNDGTGTFVYSQSGTAPSVIYGVSISKGLREGDVNGNSLCSSYYRGMFTVFGLKEVPLCTRADGENFLKIIEELEPVYKNPLPVPETLDFEDNFELSTSGKVSLDKRTDIGSITVESDPEDSTNNVLYFTSGVGTQFGDYLKFSATGSGGNCNIVEFDFYLESAPDNSNLFQVKCGDGFMLIIGISGGKLTLGYTTTTGTGAISGTVVGASAGFNAYEWHRIRLEIYAQEEGMDSPYIKYFVDDELMGGTTAYYNSHSGSKYDADFNIVQFYSMMRVTTKNYFDNIYFNKESKIFNMDSDDTSDLRGA